MISDSTWATGSRPIQDIVQLFFKAVSTALDRVVELYDLIFSGESGGFQ